MCTRRDVFCTQRGHNRSHHIGKLFRCRLSLGSYALIAKQSQPRLRFRLVSDWNLGLSAPDLHFCQCLVREKRKGVAQDNFARRRMNGKERGRRIARFVRKRRHYFSVRSSSISVSYRRSARDSSAVKKDYRPNGVHCALISNDFRYQRHLHRRPMSSLVQWRDVCIRRQHSPHRSVRFNSSNNNKVDNDCHYRVSNVFNRLCNRIH